MSNNSITELNEKFYNQENESNIQKTTINSIADTIYLYGMTIEQYQEGMKIHSQCFDQLQNLAN